MSRCLSGAFHVGMGDKFDMKKGETLRVGGYFRAEKDMQHYAWTSAPTVIQIHGRGPFVINYVNPAGRSAQQQDLGEEVGGVARTGFRNASIVMAGLAPGRDPLRAVMVRHLLPAIHVLLAAR